MFNATNTTKSLVAALAAVAALMAIPLAQASDGPPDAIDRFNNPAVVWDGPPDAIDRYRENQELATLLVTRPGWTVHRTRSIATSAGQRRRASWLSTTASPGTSSGSARERCSAPCCSSWVSAWAHCSCVTEAASSGPPDPASSLDARTGGPHARPFTFYARAGSRGCATPIIESRVTREASSSSSIPSVPPGRRGMTM